MPRPDIEPVPEIFDIHVMAFADESAATVEALSRIFAIDRGVAQRLIADAPVVVKRAATPDVANSLLDVLGELGAQVVLLPSRAESAAQPVATRAQPPPLEDADEEGERDFFAAGPVRSDPAPAPRPVASNGWGGLDLDGGLGAASAPRAAFDETFADSEPPPRASPSPRPAPLRSAPYASFAPPSSSRHVAPQARFDEEEALQDEALQDEAPLDDGDEAVVDRWGEAPGGADISDEVETSAAGAPGDTLELAVPLPTRRMRPEPPLSPSRSGAPGPSAPPAWRGPGKPMPDLGLGLVPPLPALGSIPPLPPPARTAAAPAGKSTGAARIAAPRPIAPLVAERKAGGGRAPAPAQAPARPGHAPRAAAPSLPQAAWMTRADVPSGPDLPRLAAVAGVQPVAPAPLVLPSAGSATGGGAATAPGAAVEERVVRPAPAAMPAPPAARGSRLVGVLELVAGLAVFGFGLQLDHTILHGNADAIWLGLHTFGLYGIGHGLYALRP